MKSFDVTSPKVINSFKTALACLLGYLIVIWTPLPESQWIVITIIVVMSAQTSIGSLFIKAKMRFWGTTCGALAALAIILICANHQLGIAISLFLVTLFFTYIAGTPGDVSYVGTLGSVTVVIIILNPNANLAVVGHRFIEIVLGIVLSFLVSNFIFPIRSHTIFLTNLYNTLFYLHEYFNSCFKEPPTDTQESYIDLNEKILGIFAQQRRLIQETGLEFGKKRKDKSIFQQVMNAERRVYRAINLIYYSLHASPSTRELIQSLQAFATFKQEISQFLLHLSEAVKSKRAKELDFLMGDSTDLMEHDFQKIMPSKDYLHISNVNTFLFAAKFLTAELKALTVAISRIGNTPD